MRFIHIERGGRRPHRKGEEKQLNPSDPVIETSVVELTPLQRMNRKIDMRLRLIAYEQGLLSKVEVIKLWLDVTKD